MGTVLAVASIVAAAMSLVALVVLELMREVVVLRREVAELARLVSSPTDLIGETIHLPDLSSAGEKLVIGFVDDGCPACPNLEEVISRLEQGSGKPLTNVVLVGRGGSATADRPARSPVPQRAAKQLFDALRVTATPTLVAVERQEDGWKVEDAVVGIDVEWLRSKLHPGDGSDKHDSATVRPSAGRLLGREG